MTFLPGLPLHFGRFAGGRQDALVCGVFAGYLFVTGGLCVEPSTAAGKESEKEIEIGQILHLNPKSEISNWTA